MLFKAHRKVELITEAQIAADFFYAGIGVAQKAVYENGAEYEGLPMYVFSEASTRHAISRSSYREFQKDEIVQLNLSAKIDGYCAAIGYPICLGKLEGQRRDIIQFCREAHVWSKKQVKAGVWAAGIAKGFYKYFVDNGYEKNYVYGPLHGTGIIEEKEFGEFTAKFEERFAIMLESDVPVVAQYGRAEPRTVAFYTTPGYCE